MGKPHRVLLVEDSEDDVLLTVRALKKGGYDPVFARVEDAGAMLKDVESMASHRPYRPALGIDAALNEIEKNRGTHYDNTVTDACLKLFREKGFMLEGT